MRQQLRRYDLHAPPQSAVASPVTSYTTPLASLQLSGPVMSRTRVSPPRVHANFVSPLANIRLPPLVDVSHARNVFPSVSESGQSENPLDDSHVLRHPPQVSSAHPVAGLPTSVHVGWNAPA